jgi:hypothetical protein
MRSAERASAAPADGKFASHVERYKIKWNVTLDPLGLMVHAKHIGMHPKPRLLVNTKKEEDVATAPLPQNPNANSEVLNFSHQMVEDEPTQQEGEPTPAARVRNAVVLPLQNCCRVVVPGPLWKGALQLPSAVWRVESFLLAFELAQEVLDVVGDSVVPSPGAVGQAHEHTEGVATELPRSSEAAGEMRVVEATDTTRDRHGAVGHRAQITCALVEKLTMAITAPTCTEDICYQVSQDMLQSIGPEQPTFRRRSAG